MKGFYTGIILSFAALQLVCSQPIPIPNKKVYLSNDGKLYINKSLPAYFFISTSPDPNAEKFILKSETTPQYSNPMYFDSEGRNTLRSPSAVDSLTKRVVLPRRDVQYQIYVDGKPSNSFIVYNFKKEHIKKGVHYIPDSVEIQFKAQDDLSGVENIYVSIDGEAFAPYKAPLFLDKEKLYTVKYFSADNTGNCENVKELKLAIDKSSPTTCLNINGIKHEDVLPGNTILELTATDTISGIKQTMVSLDDSIFSPYTSKINTSALTQGNHKLYYYSIDGVNNVEKVNTYSFYIDKTPPQVIEEVMGKTFIANGKEFSAGTSMLKITSFDNKAGVKEIYYSINKAPFVKYEKPIVLSGYKGEMLITSYAVDNVGNKSQSNITNNKNNSIPYVDLSAPWVGHSFKGPVFRDMDRIFINKTTSVLLEAKDTESGIQKIEYQLDSSDLHSYQTSVKISDEGSHTISVYGYDNTENMTRQQFSVIVDTTGPEIFERFSTIPLQKVSAENQLLNAYARYSVLFLSATDSISGYEKMTFRLNNNPILPYTGEIRGFISGRKNVVKIKAIDKLGNETKKVIEFYVP